MSESDNSQSSYERPAFVDALGRAYNDRGKSVVVFTGDIRDNFWCRQQKSFQPLEQTLYKELSEHFTVIRVDNANGIGFYNREDGDTLAALCAEGDKLTEEENRIGKLRDQIALNRQMPLSTLSLLNEVLASVYRVKSSSESSRKIKPVCTIIQFAGAFFPAGDFDRLSEIDRQKLVTFLNLIEAPWYNTGVNNSSWNLIILVADTRSEVNARISVLPSVQCIEIALPNAVEREKFVTSIDKADDPKHPPLEFEKGRDGFVGDSAGLTLTAVQELLCSHQRLRLPVMRKDVLNEINHVMQAELADIIKMSMPDHKPSDILGYKETGKILMNLFERCEDPKRAVPVFLVSGPNGAGKTFQLEAYAAESGRVVIELTGLRGMYYGQTDTFFEKLRLRIATYGKILILVDEAHTEFGSVHKSDTHETEKRLAGKVIKMMSDTTLYGKVVWGLMTSRPDQLDPDVLSRAGIKIPIFDLDGKERQDYVSETFKRKGINMEEDELLEVLSITDNYSARDYNFLLREVLGSKLSVLDTLKVFECDAAILKQRRFQTLIAALHCSYPALLPAAFRDEKTGRLKRAEIEAEVEELKLQLPH